MVVWRAKFVPKLSISTATYMHIRAAWAFVKALVESKNPAHHYSERGSRLCSC